jgi:hypothetical protein
MSELPPDSTEASKRRFQLAQELIRFCPSSLGQEIAVTGSVARGIADGVSDVELNLWVERLPDYDECQDWLREAGALEIKPELVTDPRDGSRWATCRYSGVWFEVGWAQIDSFETIVRQLLAGETTSHHLLSLGSTVQRAIVLRSEGVLLRWQEELRHYPHSLQETIIQSQTAAWSDPHVPGVRWALAVRNQRFGLATRLQWDIENVLRLLFAVNKRWDQDLKWTDERSLDLTIKPEHLSERINQVFTMTHAEDSIRTAFHLIEETLQLVPEEYDVSAALESIRRGIREGPSHSG